MILILDVDGTLANIDHRLLLIDKIKPTAKDWNAFFDPKLVALDTPIRGTRYLFPKLLMEFDKLIFLTGRPERLRKVTHTWLEEIYSFYFDPRDLLMRPEHWAATDDISVRAKFKSAIFQQEILPQYPKQNFIFIDDNVSILKELAEFGITIKAPECWKLFY